MPDLTNPYNFDEVALRIKMLEKIAPHLDAARVANQSSKSYHYDLHEKYKDQAYSDNKAKNPEHFPHPTDVERYYTPEEKAKSEQLKSEVYERSQPLIKAAEEMEKQLKGQSTDIPSYDYRSDERSLDQSLKLCKQIRQSELRIFHSLIMAAGDYIRESKSSAPSAIDPEALNFLMPLECLKAEKFLTENFRSR